jgi:hypothetical protein
MDGLTTQVFDDGSTLSFTPDYGYVAATERTDTYYNTPSASWGPSAANPSATSWEDVLKFGLARTIDATTRAVKPENTVPVYKNNPAPVGGLTVGGVAISLPVLLVIGAIAFLALK